MLKPGTYKLTRDVTNPKPDRRKTSDWRAKPMWPAGTEFIVKERRYDLDDALEGLSDDERAEIEAKMVTTEIHLVGSRWSHMNVRENAEPEQHVAISAALEAIEETHEAMFTRLGVPSEYFARWLVESGRLTPAAFEKLWALYQEDDTTVGDAAYPQGAQLTSTELDPTGAKLRAQLEALNARTRAAVDAKLDTKPNRFRWLVEIDVAYTWVEDGFDVDNERALDWLSNDLRYANIGAELDARVIGRPDDAAMAEAQMSGDETTRVERWRKANADKLTTFGQWINNPRRKS